MSVVQWSRLPIAMLSTPLSFTLVRQKGISLHSRCLYDNGT